MRTWSAAVDTVVSPHAFGNQLVQRNLNCRLLIFKALILWSRVDGGTPSLAAAPEGPETRPRLSAKARSIISRSSSHALRANGSGKRSKSVSPTSRSGLAFAASGISESPVTFTALRRSAERRRLFSFSRNRLAPGQWTALQRPLPARLATGLSLRDDTRSPHPSAGPSNS